MSNLPEALGADATLEQLEAIVQANRAGFIAAGEALRIIRERKLYLQTHATWEMYCLERWDMNRSMAWRQVAQAKAAKALPLSAPVPSQRSAVASPSRVARDPISVPSTSSDVRRARDAAPPEPARPVLPQPPAARYVQLSFDAFWEDAERFAVDAGWTLDAMVKTAVQEYMERHTGPSIVQVVPRLVPSYLPPPVKKPSTSGCDHPGPSRVVQGKGKGFRCRLCGETKQAS